MVTAPRGSRCCGDRYEEESWAPNTHRVRGMRTVARTCRIQLSLADANCPMETKADEAIPPTLAGGTSASTFRLTGSHSPLSPTLRRSWRLFHAKHRPRQASTST